MDYIKTAFSTLGVVIDRNKVRQMHDLAIRFRLRNENVLVFNGMELGVHQIAFKTTDRVALFALFGIEESDVRDLIRKIPTINKAHNVESDAFNLFCFWLLHLGFVYLDDERVREGFLLSVMQYFHYKIFCSVVKNSFRHGANPGIMQATINGLMRKSDIVKLESWGAVIDDRCEKTIAQNGLFYRDLKNASPDDRFIYAVTGTQTAIRNKIVLFAKAYYQAYSDGDRVGNMSMIAEDSEGEKIIAQTASVIDSVRMDLISDVVSLPAWLDDDDILLIAKTFSAITTQMLQTTLSQFSQEAVFQMSARKFDIVETHGKSTLYLGIRAFLTEIVRSSLRFCRIKKLNTANKVECFTALKHVYTSSRTLDQDILDIKDTMTKLIDRMHINYNDTAKAALRLAVIQYIILRMFRKL